MRNRSLLIAIVLMIFSISLIACSSGGGGSAGTSPDVQPTPTPTSQGTPTGTATAAVIGAAGGTVSTPDSRITISVPAGALASDTTITIQPITNEAFGGIGLGYQLLPEGQIFAKPVQLSFAYTDADLDGTAPEALNIAMQDADGYWELQDLTTTLDTLTSTLTATTTHFSRWSMIERMRIFPSSATLHVNDGMQFVINLSYPMLGTTPDPTTGAKPVLGFGWARLATDVASVIMDTDAWAVNTIPGGNTVVGTIAGSFEQAGYIAPAAKPSPDTVVVSAMIKDILHNNTKYPLTAKVKIISDAKTYGGDFQFTNNMGVSGTTHISWTQFEDLGDVRSYLPSGTINGTINFPGCDPYPYTATIDTGTPAAHSSSLVVYTATNTLYPMQYQFSILGDGPDVTLTCGTSSITLPMKTLAWAYGGSCGQPPYAPYTDENVLTGSGGACGQMLSTSWTFTVQ